MNLAFVLVAVGGFDEFQTPTGSTEVWSMDVSDVPRSCPARTSEGSLRGGRNEFPRSHSLPQPPPG